MTRARRLLVSPAVLLVVLAGALAGCGDGDDAGSAAEQSAPTNPHTGSAGAGVGVASPCETLPAADAGRLLGTNVTAVPDERDSAVLTSCSYAAEDPESGVSLDVSSLFFEGDFEEAWATMAGSVQGRVSRIDVEGADAARLVVQPQGEALLVTGFVQHGSQVDTANLVDLSPESPAAVRATMGAVLARLVSG
ncbi:hypothetical protein [Nocardioides pacificus]